MDDAQLVERAATCDKEAFAHVYDRYASSLHEYLWWVLQDREEADAALYETFVEAGARIHELADPSKLRPWLFAVASRQALRQAPRRHRRTDDFTPLVTPERDPSWNDLVEVVRAVGEDLSPRDRALLDLKFRQGLGDEELGAAIGTEPDAAAALVERVADRVEETLGETVVAYLGQRDCPELQAVLGQFDGRLNDRQRQAVEQHVETCQRCGPRYRKHLGAPALLRVTPGAAVPADVTARVLDDVHLAAHDGRPWSARRDGFPPPLAADERRRWGIAVAAALVLVLGATALIVTRDDGDTQRVAAVGTTIVRSASTTTPARATTTTSGATTTSSSVPGDGEGATATGGTSAAPATTRPAVSGGGGTGGGGTGGGGTGGTEPGGGTGTSTGSGGTNTGSSSTDTTSTVPTTTTTPAPDTTGPSLSGLSVSPSKVRAGGGCTNSDPTTATVSISATDPSGISSVTARFIFGGTFTMGSQGGGRYSATIGPFEKQAPVDLPGQVIVTATDGAGNSSSATASLTLSCT